LKLAQANDRVLIVSSSGKQYLIVLRPGLSFHTNRGIIAHDDLIGQPLGRTVYSHLGQAFTVLEPSLHDILLNLRRGGQIIYPKEIGHILLKLNIHNGARVVEAGTGSGGLTTALAYYVQPTGMVYSYDTRDDMLTVARHNLEMTGLADYVQFKQRDIIEGFDERDVDALFLDVREPWYYLDQACEALAEGGCFGALAPTTNQVSDLLTGMARQPFSSIEVLEILHRHYKPVPQRLRPEDRMVAHTGFLIFARKLALAAPFVPPAAAIKDDAPEPLPDDAPAESE